MFKKALKVATVLTLLLGCYAGYVRVFALVVKSLESNRKPSDFTFVKKKSKTKEDSIERARRLFGKDHWTVNEETNCHIGPDFWLYFTDHEQPAEKYDGKRITLSPVALIVRTDGGKANVTITAKEGVFDFNQRPGLNTKPSSNKLNPKAAPEPFKVLRARLNENVMLRHDRGTPDDPSDDLFVGPLTWADFNDENLQIVSDSEVLIRDRDTRITGEQFLIQLRPKAEPNLGIDQAPRRGNGFDGVEFAILKKNVHVVFNDVGQTGFLPGSGAGKGGKPGDKAGGTKASTSATPPADGKAPPSAPRPLDLTCAGQMTARFPQPRFNARVGPPPPSLPTLIDFTRDVLVQVGKLDEKPDQLSSDNLELVLYPSETPPKPAPGKVATPDAASIPVADSDGADGEADAESSGTFGNLELRSLKATGYAVWLKLSKQTTTIRGIELKHIKRGHGELDVTNMLGRKEPRGLSIEKIDEILEGPDRGKLTVTNVWGNNATIYDDGGDTSNATVYIQGPGRLETRTSRNQPPQRIAEWQDVLEVINEPGSDQANPIKRITLVGKPFVRDLSKPDAPSSLDASDRIIAWLKPKATDSASRRAAPGNESTLVASSSGYDLHHLRAFKDAHLASPGQNIHARKMLNAEFLPAPVDAAKTAAVNTAAVATTEKTQTAQAATNPASPEAAETATPKPKAPPDRMIESDVVWANVQLLAPNAPGVAPAQSGAAGGAGSPQYEVREVRLVNKVVFHQDPEEGKTKGNDATGEALYLFNEGENKVRMVLFNEVPKSNVTKDGVAEAGRTTSPASSDTLPPARISTEEMQLFGPIIGMDQTKDFAWVNGPGSLTQMVARGMMADKNPVDPNADPKKVGEPDAKAANAKPQTRAGKPLPDKTELTINWTQSMRFHGRSADFENRPNSAARAEFYGHVTAITQEKDSMLDCQEKMITWTDRPVPLTRMPQSAIVRTTSARGAANEPGSPQTPEPKPDLAVIEMFGNAVAINRKVDPLRPVILQKQRIETEHLIYDRRTGNFLAPGEGIVYLYDRKGSDTGRMGIQGEKKEASPANRNGVGANGPRKFGDRLVIQTAMQLEQDGSYGNPSPLEIEQQAQADEADDRQDAEPARAASPRSTAPANSRGPRRKGTPRVAGAIAPGPATSRPRTTDLAGDRSPDELMLYQVKFSKEMRGQFGTSNKPGASETRIAEFFGDIEVTRSPVASEFTIIERKDWNFRPPREVYLLTAQTLRVITEPAAAGSPPNAPARYWMKAWENAQVSTNDKALQADVITYNSTNDLFYAYGEDGHQVTITQQTGLGQPGSPTRQQAVKYHPKTGAFDAVNPQYISFIDGRTGLRPKAVAAPDPEAKPKKPVKPAIRPRVPPMEKKGFTGR